MLRKKNTLLACIFIFTAMLISAQTKSEKKQLKKQINEAQVHFYKEDYFEAWQLYSQVLKTDQYNEIAGINAAISVFKLKYPADSALGLAQVLSNSKLPDAKYYLAKIKHRQRSFDEAIALLEAYKTIPPKKRFNTDEEANNLINTCRNAKVIMAHPHRSVINNMGPDINSKYSDYAPVILPDESALYFTSRREGSLGEKKDENNKFYEDVYVSYKQNNIRGRVQNLGAPVNSETNDACVAISPDGQRMMIYRTSADGVSGDLYISKLNKLNKWSPPEKMGEEINSQYIETSACFSNDTSEIYFSSNRPGGYGGKDIYRVKKTPDGHWAMPFNLGATVNTSADDDAPFLHPDGVTLYFSSQGHNTMGEFDVFKTVLDPTSNQFSTVENLGYPVNDVGNDIFFVLSANGERGYYSSVKNDSYGDNDIYQIDTRFGDDDLAVKQGKVWIEDVPGRVKITLMDNENNQVNGNYYSDAKTGKFIIMVNPLKSYKAIVETEEEGYETLVVEIKPLASEKTNDNLEFKIVKK